MFVRVIRLSLIAVLLAVAAHAQPANGVSTFLMDEARELALARSAAPESITGKAGFYVLRAGGRYHLVTPSQNGFNCLVQRSFTAPTANPKEFYDPRMLAPICFNPESSATVMQRDLWIAPLVGAGKTLPDIRAAEAAAYAAGELKYPSKTAIAYMFSTANTLWLGTDIGHWHPHVMIWAPGLTSADLVPADLGTFGVASGYPIMDPRYGPKQPLIALPAAKGIDPIFPPSR